MINIVNKFLSFFGFSIEKNYKTIYSCEQPDKLKKNCIYVIGENGFNWFVVISCPCGCKEVIQLNLLKESKPVWDLIQHPDRSISLSPSVWRKRGCKSHFFFREGKVVWCNQTDGNLRTK